MSSKQRVRDYFNREAERFDAIYTETKPWHQRLGDRLFRRVIIERFHLICSLAPQKGAWSVLDVGCGPGRYLITLAQAGATRLLGVDVSKKMIEIAKAQAERHHVAKKCGFITAPFLEAKLEEKFDVVLAVGYFDYLTDPEVPLAKMVKHCGGRLFLSFPKRWEWRAALRKLRFYFEGGFVRFYDRAKILRIARSAGLDPEKVSLVDLGRDWLFIARVG